MSEYSFDESLRDFLVEAREHLESLNQHMLGIEGMTAKGKYQELKATIPQAEVLMYAPDLTSMTSGRGTFSLSFSHYEQVPYNIQEKLVAEAKAAREGK